MLSNPDAAVIGVFVIALGSIWLTVATIALGVHWGMSRHSYEQHMADLAARQSRADRP